MTPDTDDHELFDSLDRYVAALHSGNDVECQGWLDAHPEFREFVICLNTLEGFAPPVMPRPRAAAASEAATLPAGSQGTCQPADTPAVGDGREFGKYELLEEIGRGGMGVVYLARQRDLNRQVAVKMILSSHLANSEDVKRFYREARAAGSVRHPNIVGIHEVGQILGQHYFAMDYIVGRSLAGELQLGLPDSEQAARWLIDVARAVGYLHEQGIVHRDLKPSNILLDEAGVPHVTDFGLAKVFDDDFERTRSGVILGTPGYMSPEQAAGKVSAISARSDVYSLGAILYELLTGRPPFREDNPLNTILQVLESEPTLPNRLNPRVPLELERICLRCLEKDPLRRYASAVDLADDLERYLRNEPLETKPAGIKDWFRRWIRREAGLAARLAILAAATIIVEAWHMLIHEGWKYHLDVKLAFAAWTVLGFAFQFLLRREKTAGLARLAWAVTDPIMMTIVLNMAEDDFKPLLVGYPLLITASGLWFDVRLVAVSTIMCVAAYIALIFLRYEPTPQPHYPVIFAVSLGVIGFIVSFQVHRVKTLSRYFDQTRPANPR